MWYLSRRQGLRDVTPQAKRISQRLKIAKAYLGWTSLYYEDQGKPEKMRLLQQGYDPTDRPRQAGNRCVMAYLKRNS